MPRVVITSGGTREYIDAVRFISNVSTGALGAQIAEVFAENGWQTQLIHGPQALLPHSDSVELLPITSAADAKETLLQSLQGGGVDVVIHLMAVADYAPVPQSGKIGSHEDELVIRCRPTEKILPLIKQASPATTLISFKLERGVSDEELRARGVRSMRAAKADYVVVNELGAIDGGRHPAEVLSREGDIVGTANSKGEIAQLLFDLVN